MIVISVELAIGRCSSVGVLTGASHGAQRLRISSNHIVMLCVSSIPECCYGNKDFHCT